MNASEPIIQSQKGEGPDAPKLTRRSFLKFGLGTLATLAAIESGAIGLMYLKSRGEEAGTGGVVSAGNVEKFLRGSVTEFEQAGFYLICTDEGELLAVNSRCPHLGCSVSWQSERNQFVCPCHASSFDKFGDFESPPVPRPLDIYEVIIEDSNVLVDTSQPIRREKFESSQLTIDHLKVAEVVNE